MSVPLPLVALLASSVLLWASSPALARLWCRRPWFRRNWRWCALLAALAFAAWSFLDYRAWAETHPQPRRIHHIHHSPPGGFLIFD